MPGNIQKIASDLWLVANKLRANSNLSSSQYSTPVLGLIFLKFAAFRFEKAKATLEKKTSSRRTITSSAYKAQGILYLPEKARFSEIIGLPEGTDIGQAVNNGMDAIETENTELKGILPKSYNEFENGMLVTLLKTFNSIPMDIEGDAFGKIYEYFLGKFALAEGQGGGEFFTPTSIVKLIVEIIEPYQGRIYDPACGSGGMFVQSATFVENHKGKASKEISIFGQEKTEVTVRLSKMNLAVHGLEGDIRKAISYYEDLHGSPGKFDFVLANPPFNVKEVDKDRIKGNSSQYPFGMPNTNNANYLWIQLFYSSLSDKGRAGFVMANSASDASQSEMEIRKKLIQDQAVDVIVSISHNFFYTVTLPVTLWFLDRGKSKTNRKDKVLFIDARNIYKQIDRRIRDFLPEQGEFLANIVRLYRDEKPETDNGSEKLLKENFAKGKYVDVAGLCKVATLDEIEGHGWSLNPGRYVGEAEGEEDDFGFKERLGELNEELEVLNAEGRELEKRVSGNLNLLLGSS